MEIKRYKNTVRIRIRIFHELLDMLEKKLYLFNISSETRDQIFHKHPLYFYKLLKKNL